MNVSACPTYFINVPNTTNCALQCPYPFYSMLQNNAVYYLNIVGHSIVMLLTIFVLIPYLKNKTLRKDSNYILISLFVTILFTALRPLIAACVYGKKWQNLSCKNEYTINNSDDGGCTFFALWDYYTSLVGILIWLSICINILHKICHFTNLSQTKLFIIYLSASLFIPIIGMAVILKNKAIRGSPTLNSCYIKSGIHLHLFVIIPLALVTICGTAIMIIFVIKIIRTSKLEGLLYMVKKQIRLICYILSFIIPVTYIILVELHNYITTKKRRQSLKNWGTCLFLGGSAEQCNKLLKLTDYGVYIFMIILIIFIRLTFMIIFASQKEVVYWWLRRSGDIRSINSEERHTSATTKSSAEIRSNSSDF